MRQSIKKQIGMTLSALFLGLTSCDTWAPTRKMLLPSAISELTSESTSFRKYRYSIHGMNPSALAAVDAFHRGLDDLVVANPASSTIALFRNKGDGTFQFFHEWASCPGGDTLSAEDISGDGFSDILVTCGDRSVLSLFIGDGRGGFERHDIQVGANPVSAAVAPHVDQPGTPYLAVLYDSPSHLELLFRQGPAAFTPGKTLPAIAAPTAMAADIFTLDASIGYALISQVESKLSVFLANGPTFVRQDYEAPEAASQLAAFDLRGQQRVDLIVSSGTRNNFRVYLNDGSGHFPKTKDYDLPISPAGGIGSSHLRGIPQPEIYFQSSLTGEVIIFPNLGNGNLGHPEIIKAGASLSGMTTGHFAHQADDMDMAMIDTLRGELVVLLNENQNYQ